MRSWVAGLVNGCPLRALAFLFVIGMMNVLRAAPLAAQTGPPVVLNNESGVRHENPDLASDQLSGQSDWAVAELVRIDGQMQEINAQLNRGATLRGPIAEATRSLSALKQSPGLACGAADPLRAEFNNSLERTVGSLRYITAELPTLYRWHQMDVAELSQTCGQPLLTALEAMEASIAELANEIGISEDSREDLERSLNELQSRKRQIVAQMSDGIASARVAKTMPWILVIIFFLGTGMLMGTRLFSPDIQSVLVSSGQLVQFVTILILFGALLALGLADKLQEQTLAALLGGLAGYVLSQGIGHKERQSTLEAIRTMAGGNPPAAPAGPSPNNAAPPDGAGQPAAGQNSQADRGGQTDNGRRQAA